MSGGSVPERTKRRGSVRGSLPESTLWRFAPQVQGVPAIPRNREVKSAVW